MSIFSIYGHSYILWHDGPSASGHVTEPHLQDMRNCFKQLDEFREAVVRDTTLFAEVMVVRGNKLVETHAVLRTVLK